jgi:hypothetical protein
VRAVPELGIKSEELIAKTFVDETIAVRYATIDTLKVMRFRPDFVARLISNPLAAQDYQLRQTALVCIAALGMWELQNEGQPGRPCRYETDAALRSILRNDANASLRTIADTLSISPETGRTHISRIGYTLKSLRWIPHALTSELKQMFPKLCTHAHVNWRHLAIGDESWFYYEYVRDRIWTAWDENTPEVENRTIASTKIILTILWNPHGFHVAPCHLRVNGSLYHGS